MLTVVVLSLLYIGSADMYTTSDFKKNIKKAVDDRSKEKAILANLKNFKKDQAQFEILLKNHTSSFQKHYDKKELTEQVVTVFFEEIKASYVDYYKTRLAHRKLLISQLDEAEWKKVIARYQKGHEEILKARKRRFKLLDNEIDGIERAIAKSISDTTRVNESAVLVEDIRESFYNFYKASNKINVIDSEILKNIKSSDDEVMMVYDDWNTARAELYSQVITETTLLTREYNQEEWDLIMANIKKDLAGN